MMHGSKRLSRTGGNDQDPRRKLAALLATGLRRSLELPGIKGAFAASELDTSAMQSPQCDDWAEIHPVPAQEESACN